MRVVGCIPNFSSEVWSSALLGSFRFFFLLPHLFFFFTQPTYPPDLKTQHAMHEHSHLQAAALRS